MNIKHLNQYYAQRQKAVTDAQKQAIENRQRHTAKIKSTQSRKELAVATNESSKETLPRARAYEAAYRGNNGYTSPLKRNSSDRHSFNGSSAK